MFTYLRICFIQRKTWCRQNRQMITTLNIVVLVSRPIPPLCWCWYIWLLFSLFISNTTHIKDNSLQLSLQFIEYTELKNGTSWIPFGKISLVTLNYKFICFAFKKIAQYMLSIASRYSVIQNEKQSNLDCFWRLNLKKLEKKNCAICNNYENKKFISVIFSFQLLSYLIVDIDSTAFSQTVYQFIFFQCHFYFLHNTETIILGLQN